MITIDDVFAQVDKLNIVRDHGRYRFNISGQPLSEDWRKAVDAAVEDEFVEWDNAGACLHFTPRGYRIFDWRRP